MSHDRGCPCGREPYEYNDCTRSDCIRNEPKVKTKAINIFEFEPNLGSVTNEPSLKDILFRYYNQVFSESMSYSLADEYIREIKMQMLETNESTNTSTNTDSRMYKHAYNELKLSGLLEEDSDYNGSLGKEALNIVKMIANAGHSGVSLNELIYLLSRLTQFKPLTNLEGNSDEWNNVFATETDGVSLLQNKRCPSVFKNPNTNECFDIDVAHPETNGPVNITFPYYPI